MQEAELKKIENAPPESLTIVIPSKGRAATLLQLLSYFSSKRVEYRILLLISGSYGEKLSARFAQLNLEVIEFAEDISLWSKLKTGLKQVETPLVAMCADDDIFLPDSIRKGGGFLLNNPDYSACQGYHAQFSEDGRVVNLASVHWFSPSIEADDSLPRLRDLMQRYQPVCWAVFRTEVMRKIAPLWIDESVYLFGELLWSATAVLLGKVARLPVMHSLRRIDPLHLSGHPLYALIESPQQLMEQYEVYREKLVNLLTDRCVLETADIERAVDLIHVGFWARHMEPGPVNYFIDKVLNNSAASIHDSEISAAFRSSPDLSRGWESEKSFGERKYRIFLAFEKPEPQSEFHLNVNYSNQVISEVSDYLSSTAAIAI